MATSSVIGVKQADGGVMAVRCHWDGYTEHVGRILHEFYGGEAKAMRLLSLGSLSSLGESMTPPPDVRHSLEHPASGVTVAFHRDGGDDLHKPVPFKDTEDYRLNAQPRFMADYIYLLGNGVWNVLVNQSWIPVATALKKEDGTGSTEAMKSETANACFIRILVVCTTTIQAAELTGKLAHLARTAKRLACIEVGSGFCIFGCKVRCFTHGVVLEGRVKDGIDDAQAAALVRFFEGLAELKSMFIEWCTPDSEIYGEIACENGQLTATVLPTKFWSRMARTGMNQMALINALVEHGVAHEIRTLEAK
ncbi:MAG: hypothetical protein IJT83_09525 [Victivallales bacterium]|nr:hypothetical protein [Victivallales bacterium]